MGPNWKTTAQGFLSAFNATVGPLTALMAALQAIKPSPDYTFAYIGAGLICASAIAKAWIGLLQNDVPATPPPKS